MGSQSTITPQDPIGTQDLPTDRVTFLVAEYEGLRDEIIHKQEFSSKLVELTLIATGTFLALGAEGTISEVALLLYPVIVALLASSWCQQQAAMGEIGNYIRTKVEPRTGGSLTWEGHLYNSRPRSLKSNLAIAAPAGGVFVVSQGVTMVLGISAAHGNGFSIPDVVSMGVGGAAVIGTIFLMVILTRLNRTGAGTPATDHASLPSAALAGIQR